MNIEVSEQYQAVQDLLSEDEFKASVDETFEKYGKLINRKTAAYLLAVELGRNIYHTTRISDLVPDQETTVLVSVSSAEPKFFDKKSKDGGQVASLNIYDNSGECRLVLWDYNHIDLVKNGSIKTDTKLKIINGKVKSSEYGLELHVTRKNLLIVDPVDFNSLSDKGNSTDISQLTLDNLNELESGQAVNTTGMITKKTKIRTFTRKNGSEGRVANFDLYDGTDTMRVTLWDDQTENIDNFDIGDNVIIINGYTKERNGTLEIYANYRTTIRKK
jgi:replication factor A1